MRAGNGSTSSLVSGYRARCWSNHDAINSDSTGEDADANTKVLADWKEKTPWINFLAKEPAIRSNTSVCLKFVDPAITSLTPDAQSEFVKKLVAMVEKEGAGYDFAHYRDAPAGLRIWCGATVEAGDVALLTQWIDWAYFESKAQLPKAA